MMKKRILASSMASVMALSSASVVAFADEAKKDYGEAVTKDELQAYVDSLESFVDDKLDDYGYVQGEDFSEAVDRANAVLEDSRAVATDYTAAYQMLKAVKDSLRIYTAAELKALVNEYKGAYNSENVLNKILGDKIYKEDGYEEFADAYVDAEDSIDSDDDRTITDAYMGLKRAAEKLEKLDTVKKSEFRAALREYEALEAKMSDYEPWRRGTATYKATTGEKKDTPKAVDALAFVDLCYMVYGDTGEDAYDIMYYNGSDWVNVGVAEGKFFIGKKVVREGDGTLKGTIHAIYESLDEIEGAVETSEEKYINAYKAAQDAVKLFNSWTPDDKDNCSNETKADRIEDSYHAQLVEKFNQTQIDEIKTLLESFDYEVNVDDEKHTMKVDGGKTFGVIVDKETGKLICGADGDVETAVFKTKELAQAAVDAEAGQRAESVSSSKNILDLMEYVVAAGGIVDTTALEQAVTDAHTALTSTSAPTVAGAVESANDYTDADDETFTYYEVDEDAAETEAEDNFTYSASSAWTSAKTAVDNALTAVTGDATNYEADTANDYTSVYDSNVTIAAYKVTSTGNDTSGNLATYTNAVNAFKAADAAEPGLYDAALEQAKADAVTAATNAVDAYNALIDALKDAEEDLADAESGNYDAEAEVAAVADAIAKYEEYKSLVFKGDTKEAAEDAAEVIMDELTEGGPQLQKYNGGSAEWKIIGRRLTYALEDMFPVAKKTDKTKEKLMALIEDSYTITDLTGDSAAFSKNDYHIAVVDWRNAAYEFYKEAKAEGKKIDYDKFTGGPANANIDYYYDKLKSAKENLEKALAEFQYSYDEIRDAIGEYATKVDAGEVKSDALVKAINKCAYDLTVLEASSFIEGDEVTNYAFDEDGEFQFANRLKTKKNDKIAKTDPNQLEKNLKASYEAMQKAYTDATAPAAGVKYDFDGDGKIGTSDLLVALNAVASNSTDTKFDANGDGKISTSDLLIMLGEFAAQA